MNEFLNFAAPAMIILGALLTASNLGAKITGVGFIAFTAGSLLWMAIGLLDGPSSLVWQNIILTLLNAFGIWRWLGRQRQFEKGGKGAAAASEDQPSETLFPASALSSGEIVGASGTSLGTAVDAMIGCDSGRVAYVVVAEGGVGGVGEVLHCVDWRHIRKRNEGFLCMLDQTTFHGLPTIERDHWPAR
ncbi:PRC-barrel domain containing protein [Sphingomonas sp. HDW15A]|uniref:PRC-barrel domain-containing protein n=1 Tax=Sphingomonas sp. HDW15A TaxID=2714942 RepID=UPI0014094309|nr:PRC-barrel domain-containing protein [Sphingomonas sp. HDW15A]QIK96024.1 PRC-barrel domain containing protein [Sphingomonas sp. HDW15A]